MEKGMTLARLIRCFSLATLLVVWPRLLHAGSADGRWTLDLSGQQWQMEGIRPGQGVVEGFADIHFNGGNWNGAEVPGDVYTDLWRAGQIDDPHYGRNGMKAKWAMEMEWWYHRSFKVPESQKERAVRLVFEGVDYACDVWLNGQHLGRHEGMFSPFEYEVGPLLNYGERKAANVLTVRLDPPPRNYTVVGGRKFAWMGDYWRTLTPMGIWKPVLVVATGPVRISNVYPTSAIQADASAKVDIQVTLARDSTPLPAGIRVRTVLRGATFEGPTYSAEQTVASLPADGVVRLAVDIPQARLWWPWDLGTPNLYTVETTVTDLTGKILDQSSTRFGIREIHMERNPGFTGQEVKFPWTMVINGKHVFLRSAAWGGPPDIFYGRNSPEKYRKLVDLAREANMNNLRIFGWHPTEVDYFYDLCDELGITVWQDLIPLASVDVPQDEAYRKATQAEAVTVIRHLRTHPSLVLIEGGEESLFAHSLPEQQARTAHFLVDLEQVIRPHTNLPYIPTSPLSFPPILQQLGIGGPKDSAHTHSVFYQLGAKLIEDDVADWDYAAIPEFGVTSAPNVESIRKFIPPDEVWPPGPSWGYHWADLDVFRALNYQILGDEHTGSLGDFVAATQIAQGTIFQYGIEHMRRRKPKTTAISICHLMTFSPDMKWGIVDYFQERKRSFAFVQRAFQPLLVSLEHAKRRWLPGEKFIGRVWIVNDMIKDFGAATLRVEITDPEGKSSYQKTHALAGIAADSSVAVAPVEWLVEGRTGELFRVALTLMDTVGQVLSANHYDLLCGDQEQARRECKERAEKFQASRALYSPADYYRYFPGLSGEQRFQQLGDHYPAASGFPAAGPEANP